MTEGVRDEIQNRYVPVRLAYNVFQPVGGTDTNLSPLIFLHGITSCKETWNGIPQLLSNGTRRKAYSYDARNHGDSEWSEQFAMQDLVLDLLNFMDSICAAKAVLIGHSMGGTVVINAALQAPERVEMLIVEDMFVKKPPVALYSIPLAYATLAPEALRLIPKGVDETEAVKIIMEFVQRTLPSQYAQTVDNIRMEQTTMALKRMDDGLFALKANMSVIQKSLRQAIAEAEEPDFRSHSTYTGRTCFIYGELSHFQVYSDANNILKYFPNTTFIEAKDSRHTVHGDNPNVFVEAILTFLLCNEKFEGTLTREKSLANNNICEEF